MFNDNEEVIKAARQGYEDTHSEEAKTRRAQAVYLLGWLKGESQISSILTKALNDNDPETRGYAVYALARQDLRKCREKIEKLLITEEDAQVLRKIAEALAEIGDLDSIDMLEQALYGNGAKTRWAIQRAIRSIRERYEIQTTRDQQ
jgi:HEAT repeat protein